MEIYIANERFCITDIAESDRRNCLALLKVEKAGVQDKIRWAFALKIAESEGAVPERVNERAEQLLEDIDWEEIKTETTFNGIIRLVGSNEFVGRVCLFCYSSELPELGVDILPKFQHKGYAFEAIPMFLKVCKERFDISCVDVRVNKTNLPSIRLFKKLGAIQHENETVLSKRSLDELHEQFPGINFGKLEEKTTLGYYLYVK